MKIIKESSKPVMGKSRFTGSSETYPTLGRDGTHQYNRKYKSIPFITYNPQTPSIKAKERELPYDSRSNRNAKTIKKEAKRKTKRT